MNAPRLVRSALALCTSVALLGAAAFHIELLESFPDEDEELTAAPELIWLEFSAVPDMERTSFSVRGPAGALKLGDVVAGEKPERIQAEVLGPVAPGDYTISWVGAPVGDHTVRGRYGFTVIGGR